MKALPKVGAVAVLEFKVQPVHAIDFSSEGMPAVLSTPWLVSFLEDTARALLAPLLEPGESSVGVEIELEHLAPTPPGHQVRCLARVAAVDGPRIAFHVEARDDREVIARGFHRRHMVNADRFARAVEKKLPGPAA